MRGYRELGEARRISVVEICQMFEEKCAESFLSRLDGSRVLIREWNIRAWDFKGAQCWLRARYDL